MDRSSALFESFERLARSAPSKLAVSEGSGRRWTRRQLLGLVSTASSTLRREGFHAGDVALCHGAGLSFVVALLALWARDGVALLADGRLTERELAAIDGCFDPIWHVGAADAPLAGLARRARPRRKPRWTDGAAVVKLTSGTTGLPRGIAVTTGQLLADVTQILSGMRITPEDTNVAVVPIAHSYGLSSLLLPLVVQGSPLFLVATPLPERLAQALSTDAPAVFPGVPYLFDLLARPDGMAFRPRGLRLCISAGAPLRSATAEAFRRKYGLPVRAFYGTSETGGLAFDASEAGDAASSADGAIGTPLPGVALALRGTERRVVARSAAIARGYVPPEPALETCGFGEGEFVTSDAGRFDDRGRLQLTGRLDRRVCISGRKVDPQEIERALRDLAGVAEAHVSSVADERRGRSLVAYLVAASGVTRSTVLSHLGSRLAPWKLPRDVVFLDRLPRTARGKVDLRALAVSSEGR